MNIVRTKLQFLVIGMFVLGIFFSIPSDARAACAISDVHIRPSGVQPIQLGTPSTPADFPGPNNPYRNTTIAGSGYTEEGYSTAYRPYVYFDIETSGCENQVLKIALFNRYATNPAFGEQVEYVPVGSNPQIIPSHVSDSPNFTVAFTSGEEECSEVPAQYDCGYWLGIDINGDDVPDHFQGTVDNPALMYECESCATSLGADEWVYYGIIQFQTALDNPSFTPPDTNYFTDGYDDFLAPLPGFTASSTSSLGGFLQALFTVLIMIAGILAFIMLVIGGITYATSEAFGGKAEGRSMMLNAVLGLIIALGAWVILNSINPNLAANLSITIPKATFDDYSPEWQNGNAPAGTVITHTSNTLGGQPIVQGMPWPSDATQRAQLAGAGITVNTANNCPTAGTAGCTSLYFEGPAAGVIDQLIAFKALCVCEMIVTGGSEAWLHSTHGPTKKVIDLRATPTLNAFLRGLPGGPAAGDAFPTGKKISVNGFGKFYAEPPGATGNTTAQHWHVTFN